MDEYNSATKLIAVCGRVVFCWMALLLFSCSGMSDCLRPHGLPHTRLPSSTLSPGVCSNSRPLSQWYHATVSSSVVPFSSWLQCFPASGSFPTHWLFVSGGQSIGASASVLPVNIQGWYPLGLTGLISLLSKKLSRVFSNTTVRKHQFFGTQPLYCPTLISVHDYWKNHRFDYTDFCQQSDVSAFLICCIGWS